MKNYERIKEAGIRAHIDEISLRLNERLDDKKFSTQDKRLRRFWADFPEMETYDSRRAKMKRLRADKNIKIFDRQEAKLLREIYIPRH